MGGKQKTKSICTLDSDTMSSIVPLPHTAPIPVVSVPATDVGTWPQGFAPVQPPEH